MPPSLHQCLRFGRVLSIVAMLNICGGQWVVLQSVAWTGMLIDYSRQANLAEAVAKTFDGDHPCNLCKGIETAKKKSDKQQSAVAEKKFDGKFIAAKIASILYPPADFDLQPISIQSVLAWADAPQYPPPRTALS